MKKSAGQIDPPPVRDRVKTLKRKKEKLEDETRTKTDEYKKALEQANTSHDVVMQEKIAEIKTLKEEKEKLENESKTKSAGFKKGRGYT